MPEKDADRMAVRVDTDQTALDEQFDQCLHCLPKPFSLRTLEIYRTCALTYPILVEYCLDDVIVDVLYLW